LDKKQITSITFADISKAFDTIWIKALILKLENYGIKGKLLFCLKSYLSRRKPSFIKIRKSNGPKTDPWGTPAFYSPVLDIASLITTRCFRLER
jgi:hypothetical protein